MIAALKDQLIRFNHWADNSKPQASEWEFYYPYWDEVYQKLRIFLESKDASVLLIEDELETILYLLARDNEAETILEMLVDYPILAIQVASQALSYSDSEARWQAAVLLGKINNPLTKELLSRFLLDDNEYVRRRAQFALDEGKTS